jgi:archaellum component FlaC
MEAVREKWTDERLDDMNDRMGEGFDRLDKDIREVRSEIAGLRGGVNGLRSEMNSRFEAMHRSMHRLIIQVGGGLFGTMTIGFLGLVLTQH